MIQFAFRICPFSPKIFTCRCQSIPTTAANCAAAIILQLSQALVLRLEQQRLKLVTRVLLNIEDAVDPLDNNAKTGRLSHVLGIRHESRLLGRAVLQSQVVVVDGEDLVLGSVDEEQAGAVGRVERAVFEKGEFVGRLGLEFGEVGAVAEFVAEGRGEAGRAVSLLRVCVCMDGKSQTYSKGYSRWFTLSNHSSSNMWCVPPPSATTPASLS